MGDVADAGCGAGADVAGAPDSDAGEVAFGSVECGRNFRYDGVGLVYESQAACVELQGAGAVFLVAVVEGAGGDGHAALGVVVGGVLALGSGEQAKPNAEVGGDFGDFERIGNGERGWGRIGDG